MAEQEEQADSHVYVGPLDKFLKKRSVAPAARRHAQSAVPQAAFRSTNMCQQLLAQELGCPSQRSLDTWRQAQAHSMFVHLQLPPVWERPPNTQQRQEVCSLQLQPPPGGGVPRCCTGDSSTLAAVGYSSGLVHLIKVADMLDTIGDAIAAGSQDNVRSSPDLTDASVCKQPGAVWTVDLQDRLLSCCWASNDVPELATAGAMGMKIRRFVEGRHHEYPLTLKGGAQLAKAGQVKYLDQGASYTLVAMKPGGLVLWDCRAATKAVTELPTSNMAQLLQPLPGGTVLLTAAADGWMALYDVRQISSNSSLVVNFGSSRASQQLIASFNVPARADEAAVAAGGSSGGGTQRIFPYFSDVQMNPADCNMVAYMRPDLQVGLFDLYSNRVLQQVCVTDSVGGSASSTLAIHQRQAAARCSWDSTGRVLYCHGMLRNADSSAITLQPTITAVDFGSWAGKRIRSHSCWTTPAGASSPASGSTANSPMEAGHLQAGTSDTAPGGLVDVFRSCGGSAWRGGGLMCKQGQLLHLPVPQHAVPTELAVGGDTGKIWMGTLQGDVACIC